MSSPSENGKGKHEGCPESKDTGKPAEDGNATQKQDPKGQGGNGHQPDHEKRSDITPTDHGSTGKYLIFG